MKLLLYLFKDFSRNKRFMFLFLLNLAFGLCGFVAIDVFKSSMDKALKQKSKQVLGADFGLSARRPISAKEVQQVLGLVSSVQTSNMVEMVSMVANKNSESRLIQIKAIEKNFPFYGEIVLEKGLADPTDLMLQPITWIYPELQHQLGLRSGDKLKVGELEFTVAGLVKEDSANGFSTSMAPRIYISLKWLKQTGLLRPGSIAWHSVVFKMPKQTSEDLEEIREQVFQKTDDPDLQVYTHEGVSEMMGRLMSYLNDFLGLTALCAIFLSLVGLFFLFRSYVGQKIKDMAIFLSLGLTHSQVFRLYTGQIALLGLFGALFSIALSFLVVPFIRIAASGLVPGEIPLSYDPMSYALAVLLGVMGSLLVSWSIMLRTRGLSPSLLLQESSQSHLPTNQWVIPIYTLGIGLFWVLAVWQAKSVKVGSLFVALFLASAILLLAFIWVFLRLIKSINRKNLALKWAIRDLLGRPWATFSSGLSIGLGMLLLNLIPQIQTTLDNELESPEISRLPSLFLFDIQEEQKDPLVNLMKKNEYKLTRISPMVRARLTSVNGKRFDKGKGAGQSLTREEEREMRFRNRGFNLSYREKIFESEEIVEGRPFSGVYDGEKQSLAEISIEKRFAGRLDLKIGDILDFDIQGVSVKGVVVNFRKVRWQSFQPNFFVSFQPGVLNEAPKTYIGIVPSLKRKEAIEVQNRIVKSFPNISIVDVSRVVERIRGIMDQMSWALQFMAVLCLLAGFLVLYSIASYQSQSRSWDIGLLKSLGADFELIRSSFAWQTFLVTLFSGGLGAVVSVGMSMFIANVLFESLWRVNWYYPLFSLIFALIIALAIGTLAMTKALKTKPIKLLQN